VKVQRPLAAGLFAFAALMLVVTYSAAMQSGLFMMALALGGTAVGLLIVWVLHRLGWRP
jgi:hypothetical protein